MKSLAYILLLILIADQNIPAQRLSPPVQQTRILIDTKAEEPPVYSGAGSAARPKKGETFDLQIFVPQAAGKQAYSYIVDFDDTNHNFTDYFTITEAKTWTVTIVPNPPNPPSQVAVSFTLDSSKGSRPSSRSIIFIQPTTVHPSGLIAALRLQAKQDLPLDLSLGFTASAAIYATTQPPRLWNLKGTQIVPLQ